MKLTDELIREYIPAFQARYEEVGECWEWQAGISVANRVPIFCLKHTSITARKFAVEATGVDTTGKFVVHTCGNFKCVNPAHAKVLTRQQHMVYMGRHVGVGVTRVHKIAKAKQAAVGKITMAQAREIRASELTCKQLSEIYGLNPSRVSKIKRGEAWAEPNGFFTGLMR